MMEQANILNGILYILLIYLLYKIVKIVVPIRRMMKEAKRQMNQQAEVNRRAKAQEGKVRVDYVPPTTKTFGQDERDYVDFEEIK